MGLRPENIVLGSGQAASVVRVEHLGDQTRLHLKLADHDVITLVDASESANPGDTMRVTARDPLFFDAQGDRITQA